MSTQAMSHVPAKQNNLLLIKGVIEILWGVAAIIMALTDPVPIIVSFGLVNIVASALTFAYAGINKHLEISHQWIFIEGMVELAAGALFIFLIHDLHNYVQWMGYGIVFIVFLQFIYGYFMLTSNRVNVANMISRFVNCLVGTMVALILISNLWGLTGSLILIGGFSVVFGILNSHFALKFGNIIMGKTE